MGSRATRVEKKVKIIKQAVLAPAKTLSKTMKSRVNLASKATRKAKAGVVPKKAKTLDAATLDRKIEVGNKRLQRQLNGLTRANTAEGPLSAAVSRWNKAIQKTMDRLTELKVQRMSK